MARLRAIPSWQITLGVALLALGFLIAAQLASEGPRVRYTTQERTPLVETANELQSQQDGLKDGILQLRTQIQGVENQGADSADLVRQLNAELQEARIAAGLIAADRARASSSSSRIRRRRSRRTATNRTISSARATSAPSSRSCGARAPRRSRSTANGSRRPRRSSTSATSLLVNSAYLTPPYQVTALGPPELYDRLSASAGFVDFVRARGEGYGIRVSLAEPESVDMPAFVGTVTLRYSRPLSRVAVAVGSAGGHRARPGG